MKHIIFLSIDKLLEYEKEFEVLKWEKTKWMNRYNLGTVTEDESRDILSRVDKLEEDSDLLKHLDDICKELNDIQGKFKTPKFMMKRTKRDPSVGDDGVDFKVYSEVMEKIEDNKELYPMFGLDEYLSNTLMLIKIIKINNKEGGRRNRLIHQVLLDVSRVCKEEKNKNENM